MEQIYQSIKWLNITVHERLAQQYDLLQYKLETLKSIKMYRLVIYSGINQLRARENMFILKNLRNFLESWA